ncbi:MAG: hypothetical protein J6129_06555, partial [Bacteroidaceae bacterium]|nr:hypothetical protein [Bacteroidaceae bacterium]
FSPIFANFCLSTIYEKSSKKQAIFAPFCKEKATSSIKSALLSKKNATLSPQKADFIGTKSRPY